MKYKDFSVALNTLLQSSALLQVRLEELREFENQWNAIFEKLMPIYGPNVKIHVANSRLLQAYQFDYYHILCDDLLSLIQNEINHSSSVSKNAAKYLQVMPVEGYLAMEHEIKYTSTDIDAKTNKVSIVESDNVPAFLKRHIATERRNSHLSDHRFLFGEGDVELQNKHLKEKLVYLQKEIKGLRNLFSHRHEMLVQGNHKKSWGHFNFAKFELWFNEFFSIIQKLVMLNERVHHQGIKSNWVEHVRDQMDLILFGSISKCVSVFKVTDDCAEYSLARMKFYLSQEFIDRIVVK